MTRRARAALLLAVCALAWTACDRAAEPYTAETFVMGTKAWVTIAGAGDTAAAGAAQAVFRELYRIESVMSTWRETSEISLLNAGASGEPRAVSAELFALVDSSFRFSRAASGAFDITIRPLVVLWGFQGAGPARIPTDAAIDSARALVGYGKVSLDAAASTVALPAGMQLDLAGVAKGYAVDRCAAILRARGVGNALVNLGGNVYAIGAGPSGDGWRIGIRDPRGGVGTVGTLLLRDAAVATSGNYENFVEIEGRRFGHLIDPRSGRPVSDVLSVTVTAPTALATDALSTGLFVLGPERAAAAIDSLPGVAAVFALPAGDGVSYTSVGDFRGRLVLDAPARTR